LFDTGKILLSDYLVTEPKMSCQTSFTELEYRNKKRLTRREVFLAEMAQVMPWTELLAAIEPHYPEAGRRGRPPLE
jgi:IS5 family transposase